MVRGLVEECAPARGRVVELALGVAGDRGFAPVRPDVRERVRRRGRLRRRLRARTGHRTDGGEGEHRKGNRQRAQVFPSHLFLPQGSGSGALETPEIRMPLPSPQRRAVKRVGVCSAAADRSDDVEARALRDRRVERGALAVDVDVDVVAQRRSFRDEPVA